MSVRLQPLEQVRGYEQAPLRKHDDAKDRQSANRAVLISALGLAATGALELLVALYTGSVALLGDALHNLADVSTSAIVFVGFRVSKRKPTRKYPYGYERAEDVAGLAITLIIWSSAAFAGFESYQKLISHAGTEHLGAGMLAAVIGMIGNFAVSRYKARVAKHIQSITLEAEAQHSWLDVISSFGALVGLVGVALGWRWADPVAGWFVTLFICRVAWEVTSRIVHHLMDGVNPEQLKSAEAAAQSVPGVLAASARGRWMGRRLILEIEGALPAGTSLAQAEEIGRQVSTSVHQAVSEARFVQWIPICHQRPTAGLSSGDPGA